MSIERCTACDRNIDTDTDAEHFDDLQTCECMHSYHEDQDNNALTGCPACYAYNKAQVKTILPYSTWKAIFPI
jgi:protein-arginine kinase activator protein McsA